MFREYEDSGQLYEKYRPREFAQLIGQEKIVKKLQFIAAHGSLFGKAYWVSGKSGTGKTSLSRIIAGMGADEYGTEEINGETELAPARVCELQRQSATMSIGRGGRAFIVNEAHGLKRPAIRQLLTTLEAIPRHVVWIFTTTCDGEQMLFDDHEEQGPLTSRCVRLSLAQRDLARPFAERLREIAQIEGLGAPSIEACLKCVNKNKCNFRACLQDLATGELS